jgi:Tol biopolymer transport system component
MLRLTLILTIYFSLLTSGMLLAWTTAADSFPRREWELVAFTSFHDYDYEIYLFDTSKKLMANLTHNPGQDMFPMWSPDGKQLVFISQRGTAQTALYAIDANGKNLRALSEPGFYTTQPTYSPDGYRIAFVIRTQERPNLDILHTVQSDGSQLAALDIPGYYPSWSPDGRYLAYWHRADFYVLDIETGEKRRILTHYSSQLLHWSPDSRHIAFAANGIHLIDVQSGDHTTLDTPDSRPIYPAWSKNGQTITFFGAQTQTFYCLDIMTGDIHARYRVPSGVIVQNPAWRPS